MCPSLFGKYISGLLWDCRSRTCLPVSLPAFFPLPKYWQAEQSFGGLSNCSFGGTFSKCAMNYIDTQHIVSVNFKVFTVIGV